MEGRRGRGLRPSQVLPLPDAGPRWAPPRPPADDGGRRPGGRGVVAGILLVVVLVGGGSALVGDGGAVTPDLVTDVVTEDAVVTVLQLFAAEQAVAATVAGAAEPAADVFALPGPSARAIALRDAAAAARTTLVATRGAGVGPGTPAATYAAHGDHDALLAVAEGLITHTADLGVLAELHATLLTGAATATAEQARTHLARILARPEVALRSWAAALQQIIDGVGTPALADEARAMAAEEWRATAQRLAPAALTDLVAFLNGIDPGVLAALDGHPVAGPALARLRG
jgi:hypothetical protein